MRYKCMPSRIPKIIPNVPINGAGDSLAESKLGMRSKDVNVKIITGSMKII